MDFKDRNIEIRASTDNWGPFPFEFVDALPTGETIASVAVSAYAGKVTPDDATIVGSTLTFAGKTALDLIDSDYTPVVSGTEVKIKLKYPGDTYNGVATIVFVTTLTGGGKYPFYFHGVKVR